MIRMWSLIKFALEPRTYLWVDVVFIRETPKAILIIFNGRKAWIPKAWIARTKQGEGRTIKITILSRQSLCQTGRDPASVKAMAG